MRARLSGYFWAPCPICGRYYSGMEWRDFDSIECGVNPRLGHGFCPNHETGRMKQTDIGLLRPGASTAWTEPPLGRCGVAGCREEEQRIETERIVDRVLERMGER